MKSIIVALSVAAGLVSGCALNEGGWQSSGGGSTAASSESDSPNARQSPFPQNTRPGIW